LPGLGIDLARAAGAHCSPPSTLLPMMKKRLVSSGSPSPTCSATARLAGDRMGLGDELVAGQRVANQDGRWSVSLSGHSCQPMVNGPSSDAAIQAQLLARAEGARWPGSSTRWPALLRCEVFIAGSAMEAKCRP